MNPNKENPRIKQISTPNPSREVLEREEQMTLQQVTDRLQAIDQEMISIDEKSDTEEKLNVLTLEKTRLAKREAKLKEKGVI